MMRAQAVCSGLGDPGPATSFPVSMSVSRDGQGTRFELAVLHKWNELV